jgi:hypothetical protein
VRRRGISRRKTRVARVDREQAIDFAELVNELGERWTAARLGRHSGISGLLHPAFAGLLVPAVPGCFAVAALGGSGWRRGAKSVSVCRKRMSVATF